MTFHGTPFHVAGLEVTAAVYSHQPEVRAGLVANVGVKVGETFEAKFDPFVAEVLRLPRSRVAALAFLTMVGTVSRSSAPDSGLPVLDGRGACGAVVTSAGSGQSSA
jgi:hypothetical protein